MTRRNRLSRFSGGRSVLFVGLLLFLFSFTAEAYLPAGGSDHTETILEKSKGLMHADETNRQNMRKAIQLLEAFIKEAPDDVRIHLNLAEAYYRAADPDGNIDAIYPDLEKVETHARKALQIDPDRIEAHYWLGLFLLRKAQKVSIFRAYSVARQGIRELELVRKNRREYDYGGASRILGLLYAKAPGWSPFGDMEKALHLAEEATRIAPGYLLNRVYLAEAYAAKGYKTAAIDQWQKILAAPSAVPDQATGNRFKERARERLRELG